jgi:hypothetical protein
MRLDNLLLMMKELHKMMVEGIEPKLEMPGWPESVKRQGYNGKELR